MSSRVASDHVILGKDGSMRGEMSKLLRRY